MQKKLYLVLVFWLLCVCTARGADSSPIKWMAISRVDNALSLWQQIISMPEIEPMYKATAAQLSGIIKQENIILPDAEWFNESFYFCIGFEGGSRELLLAFWRGNASSAEFVGVWPSFFQLLRASQSEKETSMSESMALPKLVNQLDSDKSFHLVFNIKILQTQLTESLTRSLNYSSELLKKRCDSNLKRLNRAIKRQKLNALPVDMQLICPLKGSYSFDSNTGSAICNHLMPQMEFNSATMNDIQQRAHKFIKMFDDINSFSLFCDHEKGRIVLKLQHSHEPMTNSSDKSEISAVLTWFEGLSELAWISNQFSTQIVAAPNYEVIMKLISAANQMMAGDGMHFEEIKKFLPSHGPVKLLARGEFSLFANKLPEVTLSLNYPDRMAVTGVIDVFKQFGIEVEEDEIFGRLLWKLVVPDMQHGFNESQSAERAIFIRSEEDGAVDISLNKDVARDQIAVTAGEINKINLWNDVTVPVKFAYAQTMSSIARGILRLINSAVFKQERFQCSIALRQWISENQDFVSELSCDTVLDESILALCPRKAIVVRQDSKGKARLTCAVHNYEAARLVNYQLIDVPVFEGRWLRVRLEKGDGYSQFVVDIKSYGGEK